MSIIFSVASIRNPYGMPNPARLLDLLGGPRYVAGVLGIHESAVSRWPERGVPDGHVPRIVELAEAKARAAQRAHGMVSTRTGKTMGANDFMDAVRKALDVELCGECGRVK